MRTSVIGGNHLWHDNLFVGLAQEVGSAQELIYAIYIKIHVMYSGTVGSRASDSSSSSYLTILVCLLVFVGVLFVCSFLGFFSLFPLLGTSEGSMSWNSKQQGRRH